MPKISVCGGVTAVPNVFIDEYMSSANAEFVKVYIYALRFAGSELSDGEIAEKLGLLESDVVKAWKYWEKHGLVKKNEDGIEFLPCVQKKESEKLSSRVTRAELSRMFRSDRNLSSIGNYVQHSLGKALSQTELSSLYAIYTEIKLPADVIMQLVEYCKARGKESIKYIERVAASWKEQGIDSIEAVEQLCRHEEEVRREEAEMKQILGIRADRKLTDSEKKYILSWKSELGFSVDIIKLAYDQTVLNTGKLSWPYLNTILKNWHEKGIKTAESVIESANARSRKKNKFDNFTQDDEDTASIEQALIRKRRKEQGILQ